MKRTTITFDKLEKLWIEDSEEISKYIEDSESFDWKEEDEADEYRRKMERKGYTVLDMSQGMRDSYDFIVLKKNIKVID